MTKLCSEESLNILGTDNYVLPKHIFWFFHFFTFSQKNMGDFSSIKSENTIGPQVNTKTENAYNWEGVLYPDIVKLKYIQTLSNKLPFWVFSSQQVFTKISVRLAFVCNIVYFINNYQNVFNLKVCSRKKCFCHF